MFVLAAALNIILGVIKIGEGLAVIIGCAFFIVGSALGYAVSYKRKYNLGIIIGVVVLFVLCNIFIFATVALQLGIDNFVKGILRLISIRVHSKEAIEILYVSFWGSFCLGYLYRAIGFKAFSFEKMIGRLIIKLMPFLVILGIKFTIGELVNQFADSTQAITTDFNDIDSFAVNNPSDIATNIPTDSDSTSTVITDVLQSETISATTPVINTMPPDNVLSQVSMIGTNEGGFEAVSYNADNHTFYDHDGHEIAHVQGNQIVGNMNNVIASYDPNTGNILDSNGTTLNTQQTGDTFKSVTDVHGGGVEVVNGEVFDAKTHEKVGNIHKV